MTIKQYFDLYICSCAPDGGLVRVSIDKKTGEITKTGEFKLAYPMYAIKAGEKLLVITKTGGVGDNGTFYSFVTEKDGTLTQIGEKLDTGGVEPCHLDALGEDIYVANYLSGNIKRMGGGLVKHEGRGPNPVRQEAAHTHCVKITPDGHVLVTDLGLDTVFVYTRELELLSYAKVPLGYGVRHLVFSEDNKYLYAINELKSSVSVFEYDGALKLLNTYPAAPELDGNTGAAIRLLGDRLYASNRGHDSVAVFKIDGAGLVFEKYLSTFGKEPRDFDVFGRFLVCTNQRSDSVTVIDRETGALLSEITVKEPLCVTEI